MSEPGLWAQRADEAWRNLIDVAATRLVGPVRIHEPRRFRVVFAWPLSQVLHAAVLVEAAGIGTARVGAEEVWRSLRRYRSGGGFLDAPLVGKRYYDDNAWIGLACAQAALLAPIRGPWESAADGVAAGGRTEAGTTADGRAGAGCATGRQGARDTTEQRAEASGAAARGPDAASGHEAAGAEARDAADGRTEADATAERKAGTGQAADRGAATELAAGGEAWAGGEPIRGSEIGRIEQRWRSRARDCLEFVFRGMTAEGGVRWVEGGSNLHACSTGAVGVLAAAVDQARGRAERSGGTTPAAHSGGTTPAAHSGGTTPAGTTSARASEPGSGPASGGSSSAACKRFLTTHLLRSDGLVADHIAPDGRRDEAVYSYNQGLLVQLHLAAGDTGAAAETAAAALRHFPPDQMYAHPACFNAIFLRALLRLWAAAGDDRWRIVVTEYLQRCWEMGRDSRGLFTRVGRYDSGVVLDHAGLVGLMAAAALPPSASALLC